MRAYIMQDNLTCLCKAVSFIDNTQEGEKIDFTIRTVHPKSSIVPTDASASSAFGVCRYSSGESAAYLVPRCCDRNSAIESCPSTSQRFDHPLKIPPCLTAHPLRRKQNCGMRFSATIGRNTAIQLERSCSSSANKSHTRDASSTTHTIDMPNEAAADSPSSDDATSQSHSAIENACRRSIVPCGSPANRS